MNRRLRFQAKAEIFTDGDDIRVVPQTISFNRRWRLKMTKKKVVCRVLKFFKYDLLLAETFLRPKNQLQLNLVVDYNDMLFTLTNHY